MKPYYAFAHFIVKVAARILYRHRIYRAPSLPKDGAILASNHASHLDPPLVGISWSKEIHFLARSTLWDSKELGKIITRLNAHPINRDGADPASLKMIISLLKEGQKVVMFPEGRRTQDGALGEPQGGVAMLAYRANCAIIPVYIHGTFDVWSRHLQRPRLRGKTACIFGPALYPSDYAHLPKKEGQQLLTEHLMQSISDLKDWYLAGAKGPMPNRNSAAKMTRTSTGLPRLEPESSASTNSAMAAELPV